MYDLGLKLKEYPLGGWGDCKRKVQLNMRINIIYFVRVQNIFVSKIEKLYVKNTKYLRKFYQSWLKDA